MTWFSWRGLLGENYCRNPPMVAAKRGAARLRHAARVGDFATLDRSDLRSLQRRYGNGLAVQGDKLHLERLAAAIDVHHRAHVAGGKFIAREILG